MEGGAEVVSGIGDAAVAVDEGACGRPALVARHGKAIEAKLGVDGGSHGPADDALGAKVHDGGEAGPRIVPGGDGDDAGAPDLVGAQG